LSGLRQRVVTAAVLVPASVAAILWLPNLGFALATAVVVLAGGWEWSRLAGWTDRPTRLIFLLGLAVVLLAAALLLQAGGLSVLLGLGAAWWLLALALVVRHERSGRRLSPSPGLRALAGDLTLVPAWAALVALHGQEAHGPVWVLFLVALVWLADIGAFFAGRRWGRRKLAVRVSPGKSWEGVAGGVLAALVGASAALLIAGVPVDRLPGLLTLVAAAVAASVLGDLTESLFKREAGLKDSGGLLPGHGGVLDRIDSLTAAAPIFVLGLGWLGVRA
jgi:phosphatidate cytidylyltransferase